MSEYGSYSKDILKIINEIRLRKDNADESWRFFDAIYSSDNFDEYIAAVGQLQLPVQAKGTVTRWYREPIRAFRYALKHKFIRNITSKSIRNCRLRYRCHMEWEDLEPTRLKMIKYCPTCTEKVYLCMDEEQLAGFIALDRCVAIPSDIVEKYYVDAESPLMGVRQRRVLMGIPSESR